ncbi:type II toxin-antitoxin system VapC family toxin [Puteibacter caeruleilacunae]|nr:type II toxin-antitoxin system VapC family toxin [Puteibacter caeruleilacunae]
MALRIPLKKLSEINNRQIFFDANVLIYIFWSAGRLREERIYGSLYGKLIKGNNDLVIDYTVISEIVNRTHRIAYDIFLKKESKSKDELNYKEYRNSDAGKDALNDIYRTIEFNILDSFKVVGRAINEDDIRNFLIDNGLDFGDKAILTLCQENDYVLLTHDSDFKSEKVDILSGNKSIVAS